MYRKPVIEPERAVEGTEAERAASFSGPVKRAMTAAPHTIEANAPMSALLPIFEHNEVALVCDSGTFVGVITRIDLINHIRLRS